MFQRIALAYLFSNLTVRLHYQILHNYIRGRSGRIAHLTFIRIKNILNANPSIGNLPHGKLRYVYLV